MKAGVILVRSLSHGTWTVETTRVENLQLRSEWKKGREKKKKRKEQEESQKPLPTYPILPSSVRPGSLAGSILSVSLILITNHEPLRRNPGYKCIVGGSAKLGISKTDLTSDIRVPMMSQYMNFVTSLMFSPRVHTSHWGLRDLPLPSHPEGGMVAVGTKRLNTSAASVRLKEKKSHCC